jgi:glucose-6-phosphate isomerase
MLKNPISQSILFPEKLSEQNFDFMEELAELDCFSIVNRTDDFEVFKNPRLIRWRANEKFVVLGTGGSSLGGQCIRAISSQEENVEFVANLDPSTLEKMFSEIDPAETGFL